MSNEKKLSQITALSTYLSAPTIANRWETAVPQKMSRQLNAKRVLRLVLMEAGKQGSKLLSCTGESVAASVQNAIALGLEPGGPLGQAYLVPFRNSKLKPPRDYEAQLIVGYRGYIALARRSGEIASVSAHAVYQRDDFEINLGSMAAVTHSPRLNGERGPLIAVYCVAHFTGGGIHADVMTRDEIEAIRMRSQTGRKNEGPWKTDYAEMAKKTVVRRASKYWPLCVELADAIASEDKEDGYILDGGSLEAVIEKDADDGDGEIETKQIEASTSSRERKPSAGAAMIREAAKRYAGQEQQETEEPPPHSDVNDMGYSDADQN